MLNITSPDILQGTKSILYVYDNKQSELFNYVYVEKKVH